MSLKPCPFCCSDDLFTQAALGCRQVVCETCEASGPTEETDEEAIEAWNRLGLSRSNSPIALTAEQADAVRRYQWLRRRAVMVDYSDETAAKLTLFKDEGPTGEFLDDWIDGRIAAPSTGNPT
jgi:Lar family restriction alleviation protein